MFITLEGIDGSGKTTQARQVIALLREQGYPVVLTREPGGTPLGDQIRALVLDHKSTYTVLPTTELLLFCASRAQLVGELIRPKLAEGQMVFCDRYADSTLAYQGYGHGLNLDHLRQILHFATGGLQPDLTLYLDLKPEIGLERRQRARLLHADDFNRLDAMELAFHQRVYAGYEALIAAQPDRWQRVDAALPAEQVTQALLAILHQHLPPPTDLATVK